MAALATPPWCAPAARSEPACGSVRFMVPVQAPSTIFGRKVCFSASEPAVSSASIAPWVSSGQSENDMLAETHISSTGVATSLGSPCPPNSASSGSDVPPSVDELAVGLLEALWRDDRAVVPFRALLIA